MGIEKPAGAGAYCLSLCADSCARGSSGAQSWPGPSGCRTTIPKCLLTPYNNGLRKGKGQKKKQKIAPHEIKNRPWISLGWKLGFQPGEEWGQGKSFQLDWSKGEEPALFHETSGRSWKGPHCMSQKRRSVTGSVCASLGLWQEVQGADQPELHASVHHFQELRRNFLFTATSTPFLPRLLIVFHPKCLTAATAKNTVK